MTNGIALVTGGTGLLTAVITLVKLLQHNRGHCQAHDYPAPKR